MGLWPRQMRFRSQILLLLVAIIVVMMVAAVLVVVPTAYNAQKRVTFDRLTSVSNLKTLWLLREFNELKRGLIAHARNDALIDEVRFINKLLPQPGGDQHIIEQIKSGQTGGDPLAGDRLSLYWQSFKRLHANFRYIENSLPGSEILIVRPEDKLVIYSLHGESHFMDRLGGPGYKGTSLSRCYQRALAGKGKVVFEDFDANTPADQEPRACAATAIMRDHKVLAVLIHQFSGELINSIMTLRPGLGETGETYLVGPDKLMRTESRFEGAASVLKQFVDSRAVREGLAGYAGRAIIRNYRGKLVFSVWQPVDIDAVHWALVAEIEEDEAYRSLRSNMSQLLLFLWLGFMGLVVIAYGFARRTERPLLALLRNASRLARGNYSETIREEPASREIRDLVRTFNEMAAQIRERTEALENARERAENASHEAERANEAKSEFLSKMSHELRTPLNGVLGYAQILKRDANISPRQRETLLAIENCGQHLLELINDVLDLSRIESGKLEVDIAPTNLRQLVQRVVDVVRPRAVEKGLEFEVETEEMPESAALDGMKLRQVLINLLGNAIKFTDSGEVVLSAALDRDADEVVFTVTDTGIGIPEERIREIFSPFTQTSQGRLAGGTGLGLAISQQLAAAMGGELRASSRFGKGSVFEVHLPYVPVAATGTAKDEDGFYLIPKLLGDEHRTILIADDNETNRDILLQLLDEAGFETCEATNGQEVLDVLAERPVDLVLLDIRMPVMDGLTAARRIRSDPALAGVKIIALSATVVPQMHEEILAAGCDAFLAKPVDTRMLFNEIATQLDIRFQKATPRVAIDLEDSLVQVGGLTVDGERVGEVCEWLAALREAASVGDVRHIREAIDALTRLLGETHPIVARVVSLNEVFDMDGLARAAMDIESVLAESVS